jgi:hypothetical protein
MNQNSGLHLLLNVLMLVLAPAAVGKYMGLLAIWVAARLGSQHPEVFGAIVGLVSAVICFILLFRLLFCSGAREAPRSGVDSVPRRTNLSDGVPRPGKSPAVRGRWRPRKWGWSRWWGKPQASTPRMAAATPRPTPVTVRSHRPSTPKAGPSRWKRLRTWLRREKKVAITDPPAKRVTIPVELPRESEMPEPAPPSSPVAIDDLWEPFAPPDKVFPLEEPPKEVDLAPLDLEHPPLIDSRTVTDSIFNGHYITIKIERTIPLV